MTEDPKEAAVQAFTDRVMQMWDERELDSADQAVVCAAVAESFEELARVTPSKEFAAKCSDIAATLRSLQHGIN